MATPDLARGGGREQLGWSMRLMSSHDPVSLVEAPKRQGPRGVRAVSK